MKSVQKVRQAFPHSDWEWLYKIDTGGNKCFLAIVFTEKRVLLGQAVDKSLTMAQEKAYAEAANHPDVVLWYQRTGEQS